MIKKLLFFFAMVLLISPPLFAKVVRDYRGESCGEIAEVVNPAITDIRKLGRGSVNSVSSADDQFDPQVTRAFNTKPFFIVMNTDDRDLAREVLGEKCCVHCSRKVSPVVKNVGFDILYPLSLLLSLLYCLFLALFGYFDSKKDLLL